MPSSLMGVCYPVNCVHECDYSCHQPGLDKTGIAKHAFACCNPCGFCHKKIRTGFENEHNETCHKPILKKMPHPEPIKKYQIE